jgi:hypothetical protein
MPTNNKSNSALRNEDVLVESKKFLKFTATEDSKLCFRCEGESYIEQTSLNCLPSSDFMKAYVNIAMNNLDCNENTLRIEAPSIDELERNSSNKFMEELKQMLLRAKISHEAKPECSFDGIDESLQKYITSWVSKGNNKCSGDVKSDDNNGSRDDTEVSFEDNVGWDIGTTDEDYAAAHGVDSNQSANQTRQNDDVEHSRAQKNRIYKQKSRQGQKRTAEAHLNETKILFLVTGTANCHLTFVNKNDQHVTLYEHIGENIVPQNDTTSEIVKKTDEGGTIKFSADEIIAVSVAYFKILHREYQHSTDWQTAYSRYICLWEKWCVHFAFCINTVQISSLRDTFVSFCEVIS